MFASVSVFPPFRGALYIVKTDTSFWSRDLSIPVVANRDSQFGAWQFMLAQWKTPNANYDCRRHPLASFPVVSFLFNIHQSELWSDQIVNKDAVDTVSAIVGLIRQRDILYAFCSALVQPHIKTMTSMPRAVLVLRAAPAIWCPRLDCHKSCCQA